MRVDLQWVQHWIQPSSRVLDLGCGDGRLLQALRDHKQVDGLGIEIDPALITQCIQRGVSVLEHDLNQGLAQFHDHSFDMVVMTQALQALRNPHQVLEDMLRIGRECIITFPNFGHWRCRWQLAKNGRMPQSPWLPYHWYETPNIHFCTIKDFDSLCQQKSIHVINRRVMGEQHQVSWLIKQRPNLLATTAIYHMRHTSSVQS